MIHLAIPAWRRSCHKSDKEQAMIAGHDRIESNTDRQNGLLLCGLRTSDCRSRKKSNPGEW